MSRSEEKAKASLNRWRQLSSNVKDTGTARRQIASECNSLSECEATRSRLVEQISSKIEQIAHMNPDENCKRLNDDINKLIRVKGHWERQIRALGGKDYREDQQGKPSNAGYMYFGAARELPEVRALLKTKETAVLTSSLNLKRVRIESDALTVEYYGLNDADLVEDERKAETESRKKATQSGLTSTETHWDEAWSIPSQKEVEEALLAYRKNQLIRKFAM
jgi:pre-mRNA-splicing factor ISY1